MKKKKKNSSGNSDV